MDPGPSRDVHPPVDVGRQEVLEDGEAHDGEESCLDGEEFEVYASRSSSSMTPSILPPVDVDRQEVLMDGEVHGRQESRLDGEGLGELYLLLLLDDAGPSPVDVDRQEVLEDGEVFDQDRSYQDDEAPSRSLSHSRSNAS